MKTLNLHISRIGTALTIALGYAVSTAQTLPNSGDALRQIQPTNAPTKSISLIPQVAEGVIESPMSSLPVGPKVEVKSIEFLGNRVIDLSTLQGLVSNALGKSWSLAELEGLAQTVTKYYRTKGFFVARAYIPAQEITAGALRIRVVEGNYGEFRLKNQSLVRDDIVQGMLDDVKDADIVSLDTLERAMLIINDTPGIQVSRADVMPGTRVGTSDFAIETKPTDRYNGYVLLDNFGSVYTGKGRMAGGLDINSPTGRGDKLTLNGLSTDMGGLLNGRAAYGLLLRANGLRGELSLAQTEYKLGDSYKNLDAHGTAQIIDFTVTYPVRRIRSQTIEVSGNATYKDLRDKVESTNTNVQKSSTNFTAGLLVRDESRLFGFDGLTRFTFNFAVGNLQINDSAALLLDSAGANTNGRYNKVNLAWSRISELPNAFTLTTAISAQQSLGGKNLDGSERMAVSGSGGVIAYPSGELSGSNATMVHLELARTLPNWGELQSNWLFFTNWGQAEAATPISNSDRLRSISDVGIGWTASYKRAVLRTHLAHRMETTEPVSEPNPQNKFLIQVAWNF